MPNPTSKQWYYLESRKVFGPFSAFQLKQFFDKGQLDARTFVRRGANSSWVEAAQIKGLVTIAPTVEREPSRINEMTASDNLRVNVPASTAKGPERSKAKFSSGVALGLLVLLVSLGGFLKWQANNEQPDGSASPILTNPKGAVVNVRERIDDDSASQEARSIALIESRNALEQELKDDTAEQREVEIQLSENTRKEADDRKESLTLKAKLAAKRKAEEVQRIAARREAASERERTASTPNSSRLFGDSPIGRMFGAAFTEPQKAPKPEQDDEVREEKPESHEISKMDKESRQIAGAKILQPDIIAFLITSNRDLLQTRKEYLFYYLHKLSLEIEVYEDWIVANATDPQLAKQVQGLSLVSAANHFKLNNRRMMTSLIRQNAKAIPSIFSAMAQSRRSSGGSGVAAGVAIALKTLGPIDLMEYRAEKDAARLARRIAAGDQSAYEALKGAQEYLDSEKE